MKGRHVLESWDDTYDICVGRPQEGGFPEGVLCYQVVNKKTKVVEIEHQLLLQIYMSLLDMDSKLETVHREIKKRKAENILVLDKDYGH